MKFIHTIFLVLLLTLTSCPNDSELTKCETCNQALENMQVKLADVNCEPFMLKDELGLINQECTGFNSDVLVGFLAETCHNGSVETPESCSNPVLNLLILRFATSSDLPDEVDVEMKYENPTQTHRFTLTGTSMVKDFQGNFMQGMPIEFTLFKSKTNVELANGEAVFRFDRPDKYSNTREVIISYNSTNSYSFGFNDWQ